MSHPLQAQKHMADLTPMGFLFDQLQITVEFWSRAKEQFAFEVVDEKAVIWSVRRNTLAHYVLIVEDQFTGLELRRSRHEQEDGNGDPDQNREIKPKGKPRYRGNAERARVHPRRLQRIVDAIEIEQTDRCQQEQCRKRSRRDISRKRREDQNG